MKSVHPTQACAEEFTTDVVVRLGGNLMLHFGQALTRPRRND
jgi:hypothetical protein